MAKFIVLLFFISAQIQLNALTFVVKNSKAEDFGKLIVNIRNSFGAAKAPYDFRELPNVGVEQTFDVTLIRDDGEVKCFFRKNDLYFIYWEVKGRSFFFKDVERKLYPPKNFEIVPFDSSYGSLAYFKAVRTKVAVGGEPLYGAVGSFLTPKPSDKMQREKYYNNLAQASVVVIEMLAECARFQKTLDYVVSDEIYHGVPITDILAEMHNNWNDYSKECHKLPPKADQLTPAQKELAANMRLIKPIKIKI